MDKHLATTADRIITWPPDGICYLEDMPAPPKPARRPKRLHIARRGAPVHLSLITRHMEIINQGR